MPQSVFRRFINTEDSPEDIPDLPDYAIASQDDEIPKLPDYAKTIETKPTEKPKKISFGESFRNLKDFTKKKVDDFINDIISEKSSHPTISRFIKSQDPGKEPLLPELKQPTDYWGGFRKGLYDEFIRPLSSAEGIAGLLTGEEGVRSPKSLTQELPIRQPSREIAYRLGSSTQKVEPKGFIGDKSPLQTKADRIINRLDPGAPFPEVNEGALIPNEGVLQKKANEILNRVETPQEKANKILETKKAEIPKEVEKKINNIAEQIVKQEPAKKKFVNPFEKPKTEIEKANEDKAYNLAREKFNMGKDLPENVKVEEPPKLPGYAQQAEDANKIVESNPDDIIEMQGGFGGVKSPRKNPKSTGPLGPTLDKLFAATLDAKSKAVEQEALNKAERVRRFAAFNSVKDTGATGAAKRLSKFKGEYNKVNPGEGLSLNQQETDSLFNAIQNARITPAEKLRGHATLFKILNGSENPTRSELATLDDVFGNNFSDRITELHGGLGSVGLNVAKAANTMKSMMSSVDLSAPLRQGVGLITRKEFYPALRDMFKYFGDKDFYNQSMQAIEQHPNYLLGRDAGLFIAKPETTLNAEEAFLHSYIGDIPGIRNVVRASDRAYTGFLNKLRADTFNSMINRAKELGVDVGTEEGSTKASQAIANFINTATGRGGLGKLNKLTNELNTVLWSPRLISSRIQMLTNPKIYTDLPKGMRLEGLRSLLGIAALGLTTDALAKAGGANISLNPISSDFGKARFGDKVLDPWGGFQQYVVAASRFLSGKTNSSIPTSRLDIAGRFLANKESPAASLAHQLLTAKKFTGKSDDPKTAGNFINEYGQNTSVQREVALRFIPMLVQDLTDLMVSDPKWSDDIGLKAALAGAGTFGMGIQNYPEKKNSVFQKSRIR